MELKKLKTNASIEKGHTFAIKEFVADENGVYQDTDFKISVVGAGSKVHRKALQEYHLAKDEIDKKAKKEKIPADELESVMNLLLAQFMAACTTGWSGLTDEGVEVEFTQDTAVGVYADSIHILLQVVDEVNNLQKILGELKASSESSAK